MAHDRLVAVSGEPGTIFGFDIKVAPPHRRFVLYSI
jgi:hypothetical protein